MVAGCSNNASDNETKSTANPSTTAVTGMEKPTGKLDVAAFQGGFGIDFYQKAAKEFDEKNPGLETTVTGGPHIWEELTPRFVQGSPPDLTLPGWKMDHWGLVEEDQILDLSEAMKTKPYEGEGEWKDTFEPSLLKLGQQDGKQYVLPYYFNVMGWWYDPGVFAKNGWTPPKTYTELLALCEKIKAKGIAPLTYQGKYPYYMLEGMFLPWAVSIGGIEAVNAAQNLEPGAWKAPCFIQSAKMIKELSDKGYFENGATALTHTESQMDFLQGKAAMIPCGTWLYSEMHKQMPPTAKMEFMLPPVVADGKGDPTSVITGIEPWMVPSKGHNPNAAIAFFKYMTSLTKAKQFVEEKGSLMAIKGSDQVNLPEVLKTPAKVFRDSKTVWAVQYRYWYPAMQTEMENALTSLLNNQLTPEQFCDRIEAAAQKTRDDSSIKKHKVAG